MKWCLHRRSEQRVACAVVLVVAVGRFLFGLAFGSPQGLADDSAALEHHENMNCLASNFGSVGMGDLVIAGLLITSLISIVAIGLAIPESLRKRARSLSRFAVVVSGAFFFAAICLIGSSRKLDEDDTLLLGLFFLPLVLAILSQLICRRGTA